MGMMVVMVKMTIVMMELSRVPPSHLRISMLMVFMMFIVKMKMIVMTEN